MWIMLQNKLGAVNLMNVVDIFVKGQNNSVVVRISPTITAKDATISSYIELGKYKDIEACKEVIFRITEFISDAAAMAVDPVFTMPQEDEVRNNND